MDTFDEAAIDHAAGKRSECLIALERQERKVVAECVPLHQAHPERGQAGIERPMVAHLEALHGQADRRERSGHTTILAEYQLAYINML
jgi:hypothetical protein